MKDYMGFSVNLVYKYSIEVRQKDGLLFLVFYSKNDNNTNNNKNHKGDVECDEET